jgi:hypothetical protein
MKRKLVLLVLLLALTACAGPQPAQPTEAPPSPTATMPDPTGTPPPSETPTQPVSKTPEPSLPAPSPLPTSEYAPQPGDERLQRGNLFIEDFGVTVQPGDPAQVLLSLSGNRPSPCHFVRVAVGAPDAANTLAAEAYTVIADDRVCAQVLRPFAAEVPLGPLPPGDYVLLINAELKVSFTV